MRQVLFMAVLAAGILLAGCSKDEDNSMKFTISENLVSLLAHDDYKITPSGAFTAQSSNEDVATVSNDGTIHAVSAGNADIIFTSVESPDLTQTCKVNVDWRYKYFEEPILDFGASVEDIKARETRKLKKEEHYSGTLVSWNSSKIINPDYRLTYEHANTEIKISPIYFFDHDKLVFVLYNVEGPYTEHPDTTQSKIVCQLTERYGEPTDYKEKGPVWKYYVFVSEKGRFEAVNSYASDITYMPI